MRFVGALFYWNARKSFYRLRRGRGRCPCQNPSDSGEPMRTGCDAVIHWHRPARFRAVCPLLRQNDAGQWVCSVRATEVRPFWGRAAAYVGGAVFAALLLLATTAFVLMRTIGYEVSPRQIVWPPAWRELPAVRANLFIKQAREQYAQGKVREALNALSVAYGLNPKNYHVGIMLAQFYQAGSPGLADDMYARLLLEHPEFRMETARVWFRSLLARGRLPDVAEIARRELTFEPEQAAAWTHALVFAARKLGQPELLEKAAEEKGVPEHARHVLALAAQVQRLPAAEARAQLVEMPPITPFLYERAYRIETLIRLGYPGDALTLLKLSRSQLAGRDVARLAFAAYARLGDTERLRQEFDALLAPGRPLSGSELGLLAIHLVEYPDAVLLDKVAGALDRVPREPVEQRLEACFAVFCAAGVQGDVARMAAVKQQISETLAISLGGLNKLEQFFASGGRELRIGSLLAQQNTLSLELNYALLDRYLQNRDGAAAGGRGPGPRR